MARRFRFLRVRIEGSFRADALATGTRRLIFSLLIVSVASAMWAQVSSDSRKKFVAPDGSFSLSYSNHLIRCQQKKQGDGEGHNWTPAENCAAYFPVCDAGVVEDYAPIACFAYPRDKYTNTSSFEAATFSVEIIDHIATEKDGVSAPPDEVFQRRDAEVILHAIKFAVFEFGEAGKSQAVSDVYRAFHGRRCYQLGLNVATANAQTFDPPAKEFAKQDRRCTLPVGRRTRLVSFPEIIPPANQKKPRPWARF
jgi:hypothetical protein